MEPMDSTLPPVAPEPCIAETRAWVHRAVIGLNLCPFAKAPAAKGRIRYVVSDATTPDALLRALDAELRHLAASPVEEIETTLLIHPYVLTDFLDFAAFLPRAERRVVVADLDGVIQLASFHPAYQFAGTAPDDPGNATNRSPYPTLHLLREDSIERAVAAFADPATIYAANIATFERLGVDGWNALRAAIRDDAGIAAQD